MKSKEKRCWRMLIIDCQAERKDRQLVVIERKLTATEASLAMRYWPAKRLGAVAIFWPDWAPPLEIRLASCGSRSIETLHTEPTS